MDAYITFSNSVEPIIHVKYPPYTYREHKQTLPKNLVKSEYPNLTLYTSLGTITEYTFNSRNIDLQV